MAITNDRNKRLRAFAFAALAASAVFGSPSTARADEVQPTAKGIVGGALLGGELVVFGEALFGVRSTAAYLIGATAGATAGGVGGYFVEQAVDDGRVPAYMLAGGLALVIPAVVVALDQTRFLPTAGAREERPIVGPTPEPGKPGGSSVVGAEPSTTPATPPAPSSAPPSTDTPGPTPTPPGGGGAQGPQSLLNLRDGAVRMGVPLPEMRPVLGASERARMGVENRGSEVRFPVMRVTF